MIREKTDRDILFLGDTHGSLSNFFFLCKRFEIRNSIIFHVGDFGVGFTNNSDRWLEEINDRLVSLNITMYVIRGNHDNPTYFNGDYMLSNLKLVSDYTTIKIGNKRFLLVGGAISIDRHYRKSHDLMYNTESWWKDEIFVLNKRKLSKYRNITDVITHSGPSIAPPFGPLPPFIHALTENDPYLIQHLNIERDKIREMYEILSKNNSINNWYYGHFHRSENYRHNETDFKILNINELI